MQKVSSVKYTGVWFSNWLAINAKDENGNRKYKYIINEGSSRSSKTISLMDCYYKYANENDAKRLTIWRDTKTDCKKTVLADMLKHHKRTGRYKAAYNFNKTESIFTFSSTESTIEIHGTDDEETVHGMEQDAAWLNEPYKISRDTFDQIDQRTSDFVFIDWNPKKAHWIDDLKKDPRAIVIHSTFLDNPFCPEEQKIKILGYQPVTRCWAYTILQEDARHYDCVKNPNNFEKHQIDELYRCQLNEEKRSADEFKWDVYGLGVKGENPNRIFRFIEIPFHEYQELDSEIYYGVDWGSVDPMGILEAKYYDGGLYLNELNYSSENEIKLKLTDTEKKQINNLEEGFIVWLFEKLGIDKSKIIVCDNNRKSKILALRNSGFDYAVACRKWEGSIVDGIDLLNNMRVYYTSNSVNLKYEQENYQRFVDRYGVVTDDPIDKDNHLMDPTRYVAQRLQDDGIIKTVA